jgi:hypothetical protein
MKAKIAIFLLICYVSMISCTEYYLAYSSTGKDWSIEKDEYGIIEINKVGTDIIGKNHKGNYYIKQQSKWVYMIQPYTDMQYTHMISVEGQLIASRSSGLFAYERSKNKWSELASLREIYGPIAYADGVLIFTSQFSVYALRRSNPNFTVEKIFDFEKWSIGIDDLFYRDGVLYLTHFQNKKGGVKVSLNKGYTWEDLKGAESWIKGETRIRTYGDQFIFETRQRFHHEFLSHETILFNYFLRSYDINNNKWQLLHQSQTSEGSNRHSSFISLDEKEILVVTEVGATMKENPLFFFEYDKAYYPIHFNAGMIDENGNYFVYGSKN